MKLSVVTISFNAEECIARTIQSVLAQTVPVYEYIMIDGASKDRTYEIICSYDAEFERRGIRFLHISEPDKGISDAFNKGVSRATGDLVAIINADDELMPQANEILEKACAEKQADVYYGNSIWVDPEHSREYVKKPVSHDLSRLLFSMVIIHPSTFVRKSVYDKYGLFDITYRYCMDKELLYRFYKNGVTFTYVDQELTKVKAGGVSDRLTNAVFAEGNRMARDNGASERQIFIVTMKKKFKNVVTKNLKKTSLYLPVKKLLKK